MAEYTVYQHLVQYYETDQMAIVHHSNYIRWFEEARMDLMRQWGMGYDSMEKRGIISPVLHVSADYRSMVHFGDVVAVRVTIRTFNGIILELSYTVSDQKTGQIRCVGESRHCFLDTEGKPISLKKKAEDYYQIFMNMQKELGSE